jgi:hypothetical protein
MQVNLVRGQFICLVFSARYMQLVSFLMRLLMYFGTIMQKTLP